MGPLRGDGKTNTVICKCSPVFCREDGSPSWGRKVLTNIFTDVADSREDGSPSWGRKVSNLFLVVCCRCVEKMGPLRGDGKFLNSHI